MQGGLYFPYLIAIALGALIGFERAFAYRFDKSEPSGRQDMIAGVRTYSLISFAGCLASAADQWFSGILLMAFAGVLVLDAISYYISYSKHNEPGITTEISIIISFVIGAMAQKEMFVPAAFITMLTMLILHLKRFFTDATKRISSEDIGAVVKFGIITFVVLPIFDPGFSVTVRDLGVPIPGLTGRYDEMALITPYNVWLMVTFISGIGFAGYIAIKFLGHRKGIGLTGILGGFVSSTATTLTFSKRSRQEAGFSDSFSLAVILACSVMFPRVLMEVTVINSALLPKVSVTMGLMGAAGFIFCAVLWKKTGSSGSDEVPLQNPFDISPAVKFGLLYAAIVLITRVTGELAGDGGVYIVSALSGITDVDAITLTMSQIARDDPAKADQAAVAITLAAFTNTIMKASMAAYFGSPRLRKIAIAGFAAIIAAGAAGLVLLWCAGL